MDPRWGTIPLFAGIMLLFSIFLVALRYSTQNPPKQQQDDDNDSNLEVSTVINYQRYTPSRPHIVFILADDLGYNDIGYHAINGMSAVRTPHLDTLAAEGVKLENYYVQPICSPSRSVFMTGRYLIRYGLQHRVFRAPQPTCLPLSETILPQKLSELGYATHAIGKWHLGFCRTECLPTRRGFDSFFGYACGGMDHYRHTRTYVYKNKQKGVRTSNADNTTKYINQNISLNDFGDSTELPDRSDGKLNGSNEISRETWTGKDLWEDEKVVWENEGVYSARLFTQKAQDVIQKHNPKKPLFLYLAYKNVHRPLQAPARYVEMFNHIEDKERRTMAAMVYILDEGVKNLTNTLKTSGMWDDTILIFSSDNGGMIKRNAGGNNWPLKGGKWTLWEGGIRAVGFVNSPLLSDNVKGTVNSGLMHISDWFPTLVDGIAGGNTTQMQKPLDGLNQWKMISEGHSSTRREILHNLDHLEPFPKMSSTETNYWQTRLNSNETLNPLIRSGIRSGEWKLLTGAVIGYAMWLPPPESGLEKHPLKNTSSQCGPRGSVVRLYNIKRDPYETCNLARNPKHLKIVLELFKKLRKYADQAVPVYYPLEDPMANPALHGGAWKPWLDDDISTYAKIFPFRVQPYM